MGQPTIVVSVDAVSPLMDCATALNPISDTGMQERRICFIDKIITTRQVEYILTFDIDEPSDQTLLTL